VTAADNISFQRKEEQLCGKYGKIQYSNPDASSPKRQKKFHQKLLFRHVCIHRFNLLRQDTIGIGGNNKPWQIVKML
jgi:hypothetical protein